MSICWSWLLFKATVHWNIAIRNKYTKCFKFFRISKNNQLLSNINANNCYQYFCKANNVFKSCQYFIMSNNPVELHTELSKSHSLIQWASLWIRVIILNVFECNADCFLLSQSAIYYQQLLRCYICHSYSYITLFACLHCCIYFKRINYYCMGPADCALNILEWTDPWYRPGPASQEVNLALGPHQSPIFFNPATAVYIQLCTDFLL